MDSITVDVAPILSDLGASVDVDRTWDLPSFTVGDEHYVLREPARVSARLTNTGTGVVATGTVAADVTAVCARCLCDFEMRLAGEIEGLFVPAEDLDAAPDDEEAAPIGGDGTIDLAESVLSALVVEAPFAPLHDAECAGICPECGADLNEAPCGCEHEPVEAEHPFAGLAELLPTLGEDPSSSGTDTHD